MIFLVVFYVFYKSDIKFFFKWLINKCLKRLKASLNKTLIKLLSVDYKSCTQLITLSIIKFVRIGW